MNTSQKEHTAKTFLDLGKATTIVYIIGGFIPNSPITLYHIAIAFIIAIIFYTSAMLLLGGDNP